jgi:hypothetical protein
MKRRALGTILLALWIPAAVAACAAPPPTVTSTSLPPSPTGDVQATVQAAVEATQNAQPTVEPPRPEPTDTLAPTSTPIPPTAAPIPPTATLIPATATPIPPTATPAPVAPTLLEPREEHAQGLRGHVTFKWSYPRSLAAHEGFQVLAWKEGKGHWGIAGLTDETQQTVNLDVVLPDRGGAGDYWWTVVVRERGTEELLSPEAPAWRLTYQGASRGDDPCASCNCQKQCRSGNCHDCCFECCKGCEG